MDDELDTQPQWVKDASARRPSGLSLPLDSVSGQQRPAGLAPEIDDLSEYVLPNVYAFWGMLTAALTALGTDFPVMYTTFADVNMISAEHFAYGIMVILVALGTMAALLAKKYAFAAYFSLLVPIIAGLDLLKVFQKLRELKALLSSDPENNLGPVLSIFFRAGVDFGLPFIMIMSAITCMLCICAWLRERHEHYP